MSQFQKTFAFVIFFLTIVFSGTVIARWDSVISPTVEDRYHVRWWNDEVAAHSTDILVNFDQIARLGLPGTYLPSFPFSKDEIAAGKHFPVPPDTRDWSPFRTDRVGANAYLSFPPAPFLAMFAIMEIVHLPFDPEGVRILGLGLQFSTSVLLALFVWLGTKRPGFTQGSRVLGSSFAGLSTHRFFCCAG